MRLRDPAIMKDAGLCPFCRAASAGTKKVLTTVLPSCMPWPLQAQFKTSKSQIQKQRRCHLAAQLKKLSQRRLEMPTLEVRPVHKRLWSAWPILHSYHWLPNLRCGPHTSASLSDTQ